MGGGEAARGLAGAASLVSEVIMVPPEALSGSVFVSLDGEFGQELCGEIGGVGGILWERSAGVSFITWASGEIGTCPREVVGTSRSIAAGGTYVLTTDEGSETVLTDVGPNLNGFSSSMSAEGGGVVWPCALGMTTDSAISEIGEP